MKKIIIQLGLVLALAIVFNQTTLHGQITPSTPTDGRVNTIITAVPFLRIVPDARSGGMGDVGMAISTDANAMHFNASKLAFAENDVSISATYTPWLRALDLQDVYLAYLSGYKKIDKISAVGLSLRYFSLGSIQFTDSNGSSLGNTRPNEFEIAGAYARQLSKNMSLGVSLKFIYSRLANGPYNGINISPGVAGAGDVSFTYKSDEGIFNQAGSQLTFGAAVTNLGTKISYTDDGNSEFIPTNLGLGLAYEYAIDDFNSIVFAVDFNKLLTPTPDTLDTDGDGILDYKQAGVATGLFSSFNDAPGGFSEELNEFAFSAGIEYWYDKQFAIRAGYFYEHPTKGARKYISVGLGLKYNIFGLNFSYLVPTSNRTNPLDNTLRFSLVFDFGAMGKVEGVQ
jgi:opacity protein-like surface antigen